MRTFDQTYLNRKLAAICGRQFFICKGNQVFYTPSDRQNIEHFSWLLAMHAGVDFGKTGNFHFPEVHYWLVWCNDLSDEIIWC